MGWTQDLFAPGYKLTALQRRRTVRVVLVLAAVALAVILLGVSKTAGAEPGADHPLWEVAVLYRVALARLFLAMAILPLAVWSAVLIYQTLENSALGKRLLHWRGKESYESVAVQAAKTRNGGLLLAVLLAANILGLLIGVLR